MPIHNKALGVALVAAFVLTLPVFAPAAMADDAKSLRLYGQVSAASDGMAKGSSETGGDPQFVGTVNLGYGAFSTGYLIKNVSTGEGGDSQHKVYLGLAGKSGGFDLEGQVWYTTVSGTSSGTDKDFAEWVLSASRPVGANRVSLTAVYSPDSYGTTRQDTWLEVGVARDVTEKLAISGGIGRHMLTPDADFSAYNLGMTYAVLPRTRVDLRFYDTDAHDLGDAFKSRLVLTLSQTY